MCRHILKHTRSCTNQRCPQQHGTAQAVRVGKTSGLVTGELFDSPALHLTYGCERLWLESWHSVVLLPRFPESVTTICRTQDKASSLLLGLKPGVYCTGDTVTYC